MGFSLSAGPYTQSFCFCQKVKGGSDHLHFSESQVLLILLVGNHTLRTIGKELTPCSCSGVSGQCIHILRQENQSSSYLITTKFLPFPPITPKLLCLYIHIHIHIHIHVYINIHVHTHIYFYLKLIFPLVF